MERDDRVKRRSLAGCVIAAHPAMADSNFEKTVVLLSAHSARDGALGVIINRPTGHSLGALREDLETPLMQNLPVYHGGPVSPNQILLAAWKWNLAEQNFRLFFGVEPDVIERLVAEDPTIEARAFVGHAGWSAGQLEIELARYDWTPGPFLQSFGKHAPQTLWRFFLDEVRPEWGLLADFPDDPSFN
ncbi:MAG: hypothetical protein RL648_48 [Verrucomicrobiota bacterium]|jgi:putative transcriptional regulator